ncbi:MAG: hypothetical protein EBR82_28965, partial [Caulobacteraceae bacterium]|nr:hypothetical protein [Caulobacteraceae bacterium]
MSKALPSLIEADAQPALFSLPASFQAKLEASGQYTGERLFRQEPEKYRTIVTMLAAGRGIRAIKKACGVHHDTIRAVAAREGRPIDTLKQRIVENLEAAIDVGTDRLVEVVDSMKAEALPIAIGVLIDKHQLLTGQATARVETTDISAQDQPRTFDEWLAKLKPAQTGLGGGKDGAKGGSVADLEVIGVHRLPAPARFEDMKSLGAQSSSADATSTATGSTDPAAEAEG